MDFRNAMEPWIYSFDVTYHVAILGPGHDIPLDSDVSSWIKSIIGFCKVSLIQIMTTLFHNIFGNQLT